MSHKMLERLFVVNSATRFDDPLATGFSAPIIEDEEDKKRTAERLRKELNFDEYDLGDKSDTETPCELLAVIRYIDMVKQSIEMTDQEKSKILEKIRIANENDVPYTAIPNMIQNLLTREPHLNYPHNLKVLLNILIIGKKKF